MDNLTVIKEERNASIDAFRILSMFMVVILHLLGAGGGLSSLQAKSAHWFAFSFIEQVCIVAVNCFALASGFLYVNKKIKLKNLFNLYLQVFFYSLVIYVIFVCLNHQTFSAKQFLSYLLPVLSGKYWYFSAYFILFLLMPFLNIIIERAGKRLITIGIIVAMLLCGVYAYCGNIVFGDVFNLKGGYSFVWLAIMYVIGGSVKMYNIGEKLTGKNVFLLYLLSVFASFACGFILSILKNYQRLPYIAEYNFVFNALSSVLLLLCFIKVKIKLNKFILLLSKNSFGVYLLHEHPLIRQTFIVGKLVFLTQMNVFLAIICLLGVAIGVYVLGVLVEWIRKLLFRLLRIDGLTNYLDKKIIFGIEKQFKKSNTEE